VGGSPIQFIDPSGLEEMDWLWGSIYNTTHWVPSQNTVDFSAGFGDTISFGVTDKIRDLLDTNGVVNKCSGAYSGGEYVGIVYGFAAGGAAGFRAAGKKAAGKELSHWIPNRMGGPKTLWNGNYVTRRVHALSDPYRYRFMPKAWKVANPIWSAPFRQVVRMPFWIDGALIGGAATSLLAPED
jgi:hypothetical protein